MLARRGSRFLPAAAPVEQADRRVPCRPCARSKTAFACASTAIGAWLGPAVYRSRPAFYQKGFQMAAADNFAKALGSKSYCLLMTLDKLSVITSSLVCR